MLAHLVAPLQRQGQSFKHNEGPESGVQSAFPGFSRGHRPGRRQVPGYREVNAHVVDGRLRVARALGCDLSRLRAREEGRVLQKDASRDRAGGSGRQGGQDVRTSSAGYRGGTTRHNAAQEGPRAREKGAFVARVGGSGGA